MTWLIAENKYCLIDVLRGRFNYPTLKARAIAHARAHRADKILIEDAGVGTALIAELQDWGLSAIAVKPEHNKLTRMSIQSARFRLWIAVLLCIAQKQVQRAQGWPSN